MSEPVKRIGSWAIITFLLAVIVVPIVAYIVPKALKTDQITIELKYVGDMVKANTVIQGEMLDEMKDFQMSNMKQHQEIVNVMNSNGHNVKTLKEDCLDNKKNIEECRQVTFGPRIYNAN